MFLRLRELSIDSRLFASRGDANHPGLPRTILGLASAGLSEQNFKPECRVLELRMTEHVPVLPEILFKKLLHVPQ
jgi:hypothetical protein